jgi:hypothetical protein
VGVEGGEEGDFEYGWRVGGRKSDSVGECHVRLDDLHMLIVWMWTALYCNTRLLI